MKSGIDASIIQRYIYATQPEIGDIEMRAKHTQGPWFAHPLTLQVVDKKMWFDEDGARHGDTPNMVINCDSLADTHLIAAAPEMLAALEAVLPFLDMAFEHDSDVFRKKHNDALDVDDRIRAVVAKAKGE